MHNSAYLYPWLLCHTVVWYWRPARLFILLFVRVVRSLYIVLVPGTTIRWHARCTMQYSELEVYVVLYKYCTTECLLVVIARVPHVRQNCRYEKSSYLNLSCNLSTGTGVLQRWCEGTHVHADVCKKIEFDSISDVRDIRNSRLIRRSRRIWRCY